MNDFALTVTRWAVRLFLVMAGAVFFLCLLSVAVVLAALWGARALWAKLTGHPVAPWIMPMMRPGAAWTMYRSGGWRSTMAGAGAAAQADAAHAGASAGTAGSKRGGVLASVARDITDVQPREVRDL